jgi:hypothetical protein
MSCKKWFAILVVCLLLSALAAAQGVGASGDLRGTVTDPKGAVLPNATVTATDVEKGVKRTAPTDATGRFELLGLQPATYNVSASISGFQTSVQKSVVVNIGQTVTLDFHMRISQAAETVEVTSEPPVIDTSRGQQGNVITQQLIEELPINRRDYLSFTLLAPGVSNSTVLTSDSDNGFRVKQTPQSGLSFYGSNGRGNSVMVDGGEANDEAGGVRLTLSQDAVQEFQINRSNYDASLGGASGASINIVSRTGSNALHGTAFGFFRNDAMDARNPFSYTQALAPGAIYNPANPDTAGTKIKDSLSRQQFGGSVGFPITQDKTFGFIAVEGLLQDAQNAVPLLTNTSIFRPQATVFNNQQAVINQLATLPGNPSVPCLTGQPALPAAVCAGILTNILTISNVPTASPLNKFLVGQFENNGGLFPYKNQLFLASSRLDHQFSERNSAYLRMSFAHDLEQNPDVQALQGFSRGSQVHSWDATAQAAWFHTFSARMQNELRAQFNYDTFNVLSNSPSQVGLDIPGFGTFGSNIFLPSLTINRRPQFEDNFNLIRGNHTLKFGAYELLRGNHTESHTFFPGRFVFGNLPGGVLSPCLQVPAACGLTANPAFIDSLQSASLGLPQFYQQGFGSPNYSYQRPLTSMYAQDTWQMFPTLTLTFGLRYELDKQYGNLQTDTNNIAPRFSIAWDPMGDHKTVVRAGYGIYYSPVYGQIGNVVQTLGIVNGFQQIAQRFVSLRGGIPGNPTLTSATVFQTLFAQGKVQCTQALSGQAACITPADLVQFGMNVDHTGTSPFTVVFGAQPDYRSPYSQQLSFGAETQLGRDFTISGSYTFVHTIGLPVALDANALPTAPISTGISPVNGQPVQFRNWAAPQCTATPTSCFANPLILQNNIYSSAGSAVYQGGIFEVKKRFSKGTSLMASYTISRAYDTTTDFNSDFGPVDQTNLSGERSLSEFDQRQKIVVAGVLETPWKDHQNGLNAGQRILANFSFAPIISYSSGHPFNVLAGTDVNGDRHSTNDRPLGVGRNAGFGPDYINLDLRVMRAVKITEKTSVSFIAEAFNLLNRTNFGSVNNVLPGCAPGTTGCKFSGFESDPLTTPIGANPLSFVSAGARRQLQFGARLSF